MSEYDTWNFDHYIAGVILRVLPDFKNTSPDNYCIYVGAEDVHLLFMLPSEQDDDAIKEAQVRWDEQVDSAIAALTNYLDYELAYEAETHEKAQEAMHWFAKNFGTFWI